MGLLMIDRKTVPRNLFLVDCPSCGRMEWASSGAGLNMDNTCVSAVEHDGVYRVGPQERLRRYQRAIIFMLAFPEIDLPYEWVPKDDSTS